MFDIYKNRTLSQAGSAGGGGGINTLVINTDSGTASPAGGIINMYAVNDAGSSVEFTGSGNTVQLNTTDAFGNIIIGMNSGNNSITGANNVAVGVGCYTVLSTSIQNFALGTGALKLITTGNGNNVAIGNGTLQNITTAESNICIGSEAGVSYTSTESSNIILGRNNSGTLGESFVLRIGNGTGTGAQGNLAKAFISGINGVTASNPVMVTINSSTDQLGVLPLPKGAIVWTVITGASQTIAVDNGYIANNAGTISFALPATSAVGDIFEITSINNATGWTITQAAGQQIRYGFSQTTLGAGGSLSATANGDSVRCVCTVANTFWNVLSSQGNLAFV